MLRRGKMLVRMEDKNYEMPQQQKNKEQENENRDMKSVKDNFKNLAGKRKCPISEWEAFFYDQENLEYIHQGEFLYWWGDMIADMRINKELYQLMTDSLKHIVEYNASVGYIPTRKRMLNPEAFVQNSLQEAFDRKKKRGLLAFEGKMFIVILLSLQVTMYVNRFLSHRQQTTPYEIAEEMGKSLRQSPQEKENQEWLTEKWNDKIAERQGEQDTGYVKGAGMDAEEKLSMMAMKDSEYQLECFGRGVSLSSYICLSGIADEDADIDGDDWRLIEVKVPDDISELSGETLTDRNSYAFSIAAQERHPDAMLLWCQPNHLVMGENPDIYYYNGTEYIKLSQVSEDEKRKQRSKSRKYSFEMVGWQVFVVEIPEAEATSYPIVLVGHNE